MKRLILVVFSLAYVLSACSRPQVHSVLIAAGGNHTCVLGSDGGVKCWGSNERGQLGDGTRTGSPTPVTVRGLDAGIIAISAGGSHSCALSAEGALRCWGSNDKGQLGDGTTMDSPLPVEAKSGANRFVAVATGDRFTCALSDQGAVLCWGSNEKGQLGNGTFVDSPLPVQVGGLDGGASAIATGADHACALTDAGGVKCWGANGFGQLGNKTRKDNPAAVKVNGLGSGVVAVTAGAGQSCALTNAGGVSCWGWNGDDGNSHYALQPEPVGGLEAGVTAIAAGAQHACALTGKQVKCWGSNYVGQLGSLTLPASSTPVAVADLDGGLLAIATGDYHSCVLSESAGVDCWGQNYQGELGSASKPYSATPVSVAGLKAATFASLTATAAPTSTPGPTATRVPPTLAVWPMPTAPATLQIGGPVTLTWLHMLDAGTGWGIDVSGHILRTVDGGNTWRCVNPPQGIYDERSFFAADAQNAWAGSLPVMPGSEGCQRETNCYLSATVWHTSDGGNSWQATGSWQALTPLPRPGSASAVGGDAPRAAGQGLDFIDQTTGWFLLEERGTGTDILSVLARTTDAGKSLREIWRDDGINRYTGVVFLNRQEGFLGLDNTTFFDRLGGLPALDDYLTGKQRPYLEKTSDGGRTWETAFLPVLNPVPDGLRALAASKERMLCGVTRLEFVPPQGLAANVTCRVTGGFGAFGFYYFSSDGGQNWHSWIATGTESFVDPSVGWRLEDAGSGRPGQLQQTANGGLDWVTLGSLPWQASRLDFIDQKNGWAIVTGNGTLSLARSADGGHHWLGLRPLVAAP